LTSSTPDRAWLRAGAVGRPHGLDGSFHVVDASPGMLVVGAVVRMGARELRIVRRAGTDARPIVRLEGFSDRAAAQALRGEELMVARAQAPSLGPDEWWAEDLVGCSVVDGGRPVGTVSRLLALPSCEVLEVVRRGSGGDDVVRRSGGDDVVRRSGGGDVLLVPLVVDAVRGVDVEARRIDVDLRFLGED
jgi:16S rRNA processing protein RimM